MVMPSPSLPTLPLPTAGAGRSPAPVSMPVGKGAVRPVSGRQSFAGVLAEQDPQDHGTADQSSAPDDHGQQVSSQEAGQAPADGAKAAAGKQAKQTSSANGAAVAQSASVTDQKAEIAGTDTAQTVQQPVAQDAGQAADDQKTQDDASSVSLETQMLSLAAFMVPSQAAQGAGAAQPQQGNMVGQTAGSVVATAASGMGQVASAVDDVQQRLAAVLDDDLSGGTKQAVSASAAGTPAAAAALSGAGHLLHALPSEGTAGSVPSVSDMTQLVARVTASVPSHDQGKTEGTATAVPAVGTAHDRTGMAASSMQRDVLMSAAETHSATQTAKDQTVAAVKAMNFQPASAGIAAGQTDLKAGALQVNRQDMVQTGHDGQPDSLFGLMVRASSGNGAAFSGSGHQEGAGDGQPQAARNEAASVASSDDGEAGGNDGQTALPSFAGQMASLSDSGNVVQPSEAHGVATNVTTHDAKQADNVTGLSALQAGGGSAGVLSGRAVEQAGTLTMTVMTSDDTSVHVQLDRSAEGLSALSLQGQDDGTTEALQKTHHVLAKQLDEAGLHAGVMKIDVLPTDSGQMAGGQERNMPQHQGQGAYQSSGQNADQSSFQQAGGFLAGGEGGGAWRQDQQARQGDAFSIPSRSEASFGPEEEVSASTASPSGRVGHLNISV